MISITHYQDRDGNFLGGVAPRRYACLACHVPQTTAQPLVDNLFTDMDALAEPERVKNLDPGGRPIVVYCGGGACELSINLSRVLIEGGKRRVLIYEAGYPEWESAGYPVAKGPNP